MKLSIIDNRALIMLAAAIAAVSCQWNPADHDLEPVDETLSLTASSENVVLLEENLKNDAITFSWTEARNMGEDYLVSYETKLDVLGNNFGSKTVIRTDMDPGEFSQCFTVEQLNTWATERWGLPVNKQFTLEYRVTAQWEGGSTFEMPEVRTVQVLVTPIKVTVFDADKMFVGGTSVDESEISRTLENEFQFAWLGELTIGDLQIPVEYEGLRYYIAPKDGVKILKDGQAVDITMTEEPFSWDIASAGQYRVVVDMKTAKATIYSPATDLKPLTISWYPNQKLPSEEANGRPLITTTIDKLYGRGESVGWSAAGKDLKCSVSLADPQILIYSGNILGSGRTDFAVISNLKVDGYNDGNAYTVNNSYVFAPTFTGSNYDLSVTMGKWMDMEGGSHLRGNYFKVPSGTNFIIFDLRNMRIWMEKR